MVGHLINSLISFLLVATAVFFLVIKPMNMLVYHLNKKYAKQSLE